MISKFLFPSKFKTPGLILLISGLVLGIPNVFFGFEPSFLDISTFCLYGGNGFLSGSNVFCSFIETNVYNEIISVAIIVGGLLYGCSKEKEEDEFISKLRLDSLLIATYMNYGLLILTIIFIYGMPFFTVIVFNMFTLLFFFTIRFKYVLHQHQKTAEWAID